MHCVLNVGGLISRNGIIKQCNHHEIFKNNIGDKLMGECKKSVIKESKKNSINLYKKEKYGIEG